MELRKFAAPEFIIGNGSRALAAQYARNFGARRVFVVSDEGVRRAGWTGELTASLDAAGMPFTLFSDVSENPRAGEVMAGAAAYVRDGCNLIIAIGGGSPMDCAKGIGIVTSNGQHVLEFEGVDEVAAPGPPLICIPTTSGSSADLSQFAIISDEERRVKIAIVSKTMLPDLSLIDPDTTTTMDSRLTACAGFDVLVHGVEAYVSNAHSPITDLHALAAIPLVMEHLAAATREPMNMAAREGMCLAAMHAGLAFSNASLGATHAMAHCLGGYADLVHGEVNAILLRHVSRFNYSSVPERYRAIAEAMGLPPGTDDVIGFIHDRLLALQQAIGLARPLRLLGLELGDLARLAEFAMNDPCMVTNPRTPSVSEIEELYGQAF